jgi:hypothetical protein
MLTHGPQLRVPISRRRACVTEGDHRVERRATPRLCPRGASPRSEVPGMLPLSLSSPCHTHPHGCAVGMVSHAPRCPRSSDGIWGKDAGASVCFQGTCKRTHGPTRGHATRTRRARWDALCSWGVWIPACDDTVARSERRWRGPRSNAGLACTTRPSPWGSIWTDPASPHRNKGYN